VRLPGLPPILDFRRLSDHDRLRHAPPEAHEVARRCGNMRLNYGYGSGAMKLVLVLLAAAGLWAATDPRAAAEKPSRLWR